MKSTLLLLVTSLLMGAVYGTAVFAAGAQATVAPSGQVMTAKQGGGNDPLLTGDLHLKSASGPFSFQALRGNIVVMFFGYTHCPDVCPRDMSIIARAFGQFDAKQQARLRGVFVSLDPARDDAKTLKDFAQYFNPHFVGVTGSQQDIDALAKRYGIHYKKVPVPGSDGEYSIEHTATIYILDGQGRVSFIMPNGISDMALQQAIQFLLDEQHG